MAPLNRRHASHPCEATAIEIASRRPAVGLRSALLAGAVLAQPVGWRPERRDPNAIREGVRGGIAAAIIGA
jgi:hypothetical protein